MSYITTTELKTYKGSQDDDNNLLAIYINSAEKIIEDYLGYSLELKEYVLYLSGIGTDRILIPVYPVYSISSLIIDGVEQNVDDFLIDGKFIVSINSNNVFTDGINNIYIEFTAGFDTIPDVVKLTILRIATLLSLESEGNIGITNKSFSDGSRTFINYTNFSKYLSPLDNLKINRF